MRFVVGCLAFVVSLAQATAAPRTVFLESRDLPITSFNITFETGSADDPQGKEGLADLVATLMREGGVREYRLGNKVLPARSRAALEEALFPLAAEVEVTVGDEQTAFHVTSAASVAEPVLELLLQMILAPAFSPGDFERLKGESLDALTQRYPREDEEELGKAALDQSIYGKAHPYAHVVTGTVEGVRHIALDDVRAFHTRLFTQARVIVGAGGMLSPELRQHLSSALTRLPEGEPRKKPAPAAAPSEKKLLLVKGPFEATGAHLGEPIALTRGSPEFPSLYLAALAFGKHRSFVGRLMRVVREERGLNYGAYAYVENFPDGGSRLSEPTQAARSRQAFTVWARPTPQENGCFLARQIARETEAFAARGLSREEFELARSHLIGVAPTLALSLDRRLGYAIDSIFYGIEGDYLRTLQRGARAARLEAVNKLVRRTLDPAQLRYVVVTPDPDKLKSELLSAECPIHYPAGVEKSKKIKKEDNLIARYKLGLKPEDIAIVDAESIFAK